MINFLDGCRLHPSYAGLADDSAAAYNHMGVGASEGRCLARSKEYFEWCGNELHQQIMATYIPTGEVKLPACRMPCVADVMRLKWLPRALSQGSVFPSDDVVEQAIERLSAAAPPAAPPPAPAPAPERQTPPSNTCEGGTCPADKMEGTRDWLTKAMLLATQICDVATLAGSHIASANGRASVLVGIAAALAVYVGTQAMRLVLRVRDWMRDFIFVRTVDWKSPQRQGLLKDPTGWRKDRVGIDILGVVAVLDEEWAAAVKRRDPKVDRHANPFKHIAPKASQGLRALVKKYQQTNVFLIAEASSARQERAVLEFLEETRVLTGPGILANHSHVFVLDSRHLLKQAREVAKEVGITDVLTSRPEVAEALSPVCSGSIFLFADEPVPPQGSVPKRGWFGRWFARDSVSVPSPGRARGAGDRAAAAAAADGSEAEGAEKGSGAGKTKGRDKSGGAAREGRAEKEASPAAGRDVVEGVGRGGEQTAEQAEASGEGAVKCGSDDGRTELAESAAVAGEGSPGMGRGKGGGDVGSRPTGQGCVEGSEDPACASVASERGSRGEAAAVAAVDGRESKAVYVGAPPKGWEVRGRGLRGSSAWCVLCGGRGTHARCGVSWQVAHPEPSVPRDRGAGGVPQARHVGARAG